MSEQNDVLLDMALSLARQGDYVEARRLVRQVLNRDPNDDLAWAMSARFAQTDEEAAACWREVVRLRPDDEEARAQLERVKPGEMIASNPPIKRAPETKVKAVPRPTKQIPVFDPTVREAPVTVRLPQVDPAAIPSNRRTKKCPYCAEEILEEAIKCRYCGSDLTPKQPEYEVETILYEARESRLTPVYWLGMIFTVGLYSIVWASKSVMVTTERIIWKTGVINRTERNIPLDKVQDVTVRRGLMGAIFGYGNLIVETAGSSGPEIVFENMGNPDDVKEFILMAVQRKRAGR